MSSSLSGCKDFFFKYWIEKAPKQSINQSIDQRPLLDIEKKTIYLGWLCVSYALSEFIARCFKTFVSPIFCWNCGREVSGKFHKGVKSHLGWYKLNQSINQKINTIGTGPMIGSGSDRASLSSGMLPPIKNTVFFMLGHFVMHQNEFSFEVLYAMIAKILFSTCWNIVWCIKTN